MKKTLHIANVDGMIHAFRFDLLLELQNNGYEIHIAASITNEKLVNDFKKAGFTFHKINMERGVKPLNALKSTLEVARLIKNNTFDIIHTNTPTGGMIGRMGAYLAGHQRIYHTTGGFYFHENMSRTKYWFYSAIERYLTSKTHILFSPNKEDIRTCEERNIRPIESIQYCGPSGVKMEKYDIEDKDLCSKKLKEDLNLEEDTLIIGSMGRLVWEKGLKEFIDVIDKLNRSGHKVQGVCVGKGPQSEAIKAYSKEKKCTNITFVGYRTNTSFYSKAFDILVFPSYREGFPIVTLEAMASKTPVVAFNIRGCRESIIHGETGFLVDFKDVDAMFETVKKLISNQDLIKELGENGRKRVIHNFTKEHHIKRQLPFY